MTAILKKEAVAQYRVVIMQGAHILYVSHAHYCKELARGYVAGIRQQLANDIGRQQLSAKSIKS
jgi:hypothetical protein